MRTTAVFDKHVDPRLFAAIFAGWTLIAAATTKPKMRYVGPYPTDEDHYDVLQLGWENDALVITGDGGMIGKAQDFGRCGSHEHYLNGVIVLPPDQRRQVELLTKLIDGRLKIARIDDDDSAVVAIRDSNLGVDLRAKQPVAEPLCGCPWIDDEERRRRRYKRQ
jgi:hypothetical protein